MPDAIVDLTDLTRKLATRDAARTEATAQSLHTLLLTAPLELEPGHVRDIVLEQPAGQRRRIDVEVGQCVFEVKRDLRKGTVRKDAEVQLAGYVAQRREQTGQRYVGVLTDGCEWHLYRLQEDVLAPVSSLTVNEDNPDIYALCVGWKAFWPPASSSHPSLEKSIACSAHGRPATCSTSPSSPTSTKQAVTAPTCSSSASCGRGCSPRPWEPPFATTIGCSCSTRCWS